MDQPSPASNTGPSNATIPHCEYSSLSQQVAALFLVQHNTWCQDEYDSVSDEQLNSDLICAIVQTDISTTFTLTSIEQLQLSS